MTYQNPMYTNALIETQKLLSIFFEGNDLPPNSPELTKEIRSLIEAGGDLNALDSNDSTVFMAAVDPILTKDSDYREWIAFLVAHNANIEHHNKGGFGAFFWAYKDADIEHLQVLFDFKVPAFEQTNEHGSIMDEAIRVGNAYKFQFMLDKWNEHFFNKSEEEKIKQYNDWIKLCDYLDNDWLATAQDPTPDYKGIKQILLSELEKNLLNQATPKYAPSSPQENMPSPHSTKNSHKI